MKPQTFHGLDGDRTLSVIHLRDGSLQLAIKARGKFVETIHLAPADRASAARAIEGNAHG